MKRLVFAVVVFALLATATPATANVILRPVTAEARSEAVLEFEVRNEWEEATRIVAIRMPANLNVESASGRAGGWNAVSEGTPVSAVIFRGSLAPGERATFAVTMRVPDVRVRMRFDVQQALASGRVISEAAALDILDASGGSAEDTSVPEATTTSTTVTFRPSEPSDSGVLQKIFSYALAVAVTIGLVIFIRNARAKS